MKYQEVHPSNDFFILLSLLARFWGTNQTILWIFLKIPRNRPTRTPDFPKIKNIGQVPIIIVCKMTTKPSDSYPGFVEKNSTIHQMVNSLFS